VTDRPPKRDDRRFGRAGAATMVVLALAATLAAAYLTYTKLLGEVPACGPLRGCETVSSSPYAAFLGVPVAAFGLAMSFAILVATAWWWRRGDRPGLYAAYGLGLLGVFVVGYLTYLELFVIHAVCAWCVAYAATVVLGWILSALALRART
jgi:uncharacterized membrane protein